MDFDDFMRAVCPDFGLDLKLPPTGALEERCQEWVQRILTNKPGTVGEHVQATVLHILQNCPEPIANLRLETLHRDLVTPSDGSPPFFLNKTQRHVIRQFLTYGFYDPKTLNKNRHNKEVSEIGHLGFPTRPVSRKQGKIFLLDFTKPSVVEGTDVRYDLTAAEREAIFKAYGYRCAFCNRHRDLDKVDLVLDHKKPFAVDGNRSANASRLEAFQCSCTKCNIIKLGACVRCKKLDGGGPETCDGCFYVNPDDCTHMATNPLRKLTTIHSARGIQ